MGIIAALFATFIGFGVLSPRCLVRPGIAKANDGFQVEWNEYVPDGTPAAATVMIMPPTGGSTYLERRYAQGLCLRHHRAVIVEQWSGLNEQNLDFELHNRLHARAHRAFEIVSANYQGPLRLLGTSLGAQYGFSIAMRTARVERVVLIVGGAPFSEVIARSEHESMSHLRIERTRAMNIPSQKDYEARLQKVFVWDDTDLLAADPSISKKVLMVVGLKDTAVPTEQQLKLANGLKHVQVIKISNGHLGTIVKAYFLHAREIFNFLTK